MSDTTTPPAPSAYDPEQLAQILQTLRGPQQPAAPPAPVDRSIVSLLGEAVGGGTTGLSPADREAAGTRALLNFGANLSAASGPSTMPRSFGQIFAQGVGGAEQSLGSSEAVAASRLAAQQQYEEKQQELRLAAIREALPFLQYQAASKAADAAAAIAGNKPAPAPGTSISDVGAPVIPRDPNAGTAGQQANNPGNIMLTPGATVAGASGAIPLPGGRYVAAFPDVPTGVAAHSDLLTKYAQSGVSTIRDAVTRWVNDPKADLTSYVADVAKAAGVGPDDKVDLSDPKIQRAILLAQQPHESGKAWLSPADVDKGIALAAARRAAPPAATGGTQAPAPYKVASAGPTAPPAPTAAPTAAPAPGSVAAETAGLKVPPGTTAAAAPAPAPVTAAPPGAQAAPAVAAPAVAAPATTTAPPVPDHPDVVSGDIVFRHPGLLEDFKARNRPPLPTTPDFDPNLDPDTLNAFAAKAKGLAVQSALTPTITDPVARQKAITDIAAQQAALTAEQGNAAAAKRLSAADKATEFNKTQDAAMEKRYDAALATYTGAQKDRMTFNQDLTKSAAAKEADFNEKMLAPYQTGATQAQGILPNIDLAKQVLTMLPERPVPQLDEVTKNRLAAVEPYLPKNYRDTLKGADLFNQVMGGMVSQMGANVQSGQPGGRESAYDQFKTMLPSLAQTQSGRETALLMVEELAKRRIAENTFLQNYAHDQKNINPTTQVADMSHAGEAMNAALPPMLQLPPPGYDPSISRASPNAARNEQRYVDYFNNSVPDGGRYVHYEQDDEGKFHPVVKTKQPGQKATYR